MGARKKLTRTMRAEQRKQAFHLKQMRMLANSRGTPREASELFREMVESGQVHLVVDPDESEAES